MRPTTGRRTARAREFLETYTRDLKAQDLQRLFTRDTQEAYRFFARGINPAVLDGLPIHRRFFGHLRLFFLAFTLKLSPARRAIYGLGLLSVVFGLLQLFRGFGLIRLPIIPFIVDVSIPAPVWQDGTAWLVLGFLVLNLLVLLEVADRLSLKNDLEIAREIQQAMLPRETHRAPGVEAFGMTRPANTVGGDFYDILPLPDGRLAIALGDVAGKGSPAALLMALLLAMLRTLVDEGLEPAALLDRLNVQVSRHSPASRFITLFYAVFDPLTGELTYANAGHTPPLVLRRGGRVDRLTDGGMALGLFEPATYRAFETRLDADELLVVYSDGVTEAEDPSGRPFDEAGLERTIARHRIGGVSQLGQAIFDAVARHADAERFADDLTILLLRRMAGAVPELSAPVSHAGV